MPTMSADSSSSPTKRLRGMSLAALANLVGTLGIEATSAAKKKNKKQVLVNQLIDHFLLNPSANFIGMIEAANAPVVDSSASSIPRFDLLPGQAKHGKTKLPPQTSGHNPLIPTTPSRSSHPPPQSSLPSLVFTPEPPTLLSAAPPSPDVFFADSTTRAESVQKVRGQLQQVPETWTEPPFEDVDATAATTEEDVTVVKIFTPPRPRASPTPVPVHKPQFSLPDLPKYRQGQPYHHSDNLSESLSHLVYWAKTSLYASKACRPPTTETLDALPPNGVFVTPDSCDRLERIVRDFRDYLNTEQQQTGELRPTFEEFVRKTNEFLRGADRLEDTFAQHLMVCLHSVVTRVLRLDVFDNHMSKDGWEIAFERSQAVDLVIEPRRLAGPKRSNQERQSSRLQRESRLLSSPMFKDVNPAIAAERRAQAEEQQRTAIELKTENSGDDEMYDEGLDVVKDALHAGFPLRLYRAADPDYKPSKSKPAAAPEVLMVSEPLEESFSHRVAQVTQYLFGKVKMNNRLYPPPEVTSFNGKSFWVAFRVGESEMEITKLYKYDGNIRFPEAEIALAWAQSIGHPLLHSPADKKKESST